MTRLYPATALISPRSRTDFFPRLIAVLLGGLFGSLPALASDILPHTATYASSSYGMSVTLQQTLQPLDGKRWKMHNHSELLFADIDETAEFEIRDNRVVPLSYDYHNGLSDKKDSELRFDWNAGKVVERLQDNHSNKLNKAAWDSLSFQTQLRLALLNQRDAFEQTDYPLVVRNKIKTYRVTPLGEERLQTDLGTFDTVKLKQQRPGKDSYTLIWLASDWDFMILRLQRIDEGKVKYQIDLESVQMGGRSLAKN